MGGSPRIRTLSGRLALPILAELRRRGIDADAILAALHLGEDRFRKLDGRISVDAFLELVQRARDASGDLAIALEAVTRLDRDSFPVELHLVSSRATMRDGMRFVAPFVAHMIDGLDLRVEPHGEAAFARFELEGAPLAPPALAEYVLFSLWSFVRRMAPSSPPPTEVHLAHRTPAFGSSLGERIGAVARYGGNRVGFVFAWANIDLPVEGADPELGDALLKVASSWTAPHADLRVRDRARAVLAATLGEGDDDATSATRVAEALQMNERTLRRHLEAEGTSLRSLLDDLRRARADELLAGGPGNLEAVAQALGFSGANAFGRAYRRWHGRAPSADAKARKNARRVDGPTRR